LELVLLEPSDHEGFDYVVKNVSSMSVNETAEQNMGGFYKGCDKIGH
jgi:hypothetical protein